MLNKWQVRRFSGHGWTWDIQQVGPCPTCSWVNSLWSHVLDATCWRLPPSNLEWLLESEQMSTFFLCIDTRTWSRPAEMPLLIDWDPFLGAAKLVTLEVPKWVISRFREALSFGNPWKVSDPELGIHWTVDSSYTEPGLNCTYVWWPWGLKRCVLYWWEVYNSNTVSRFCMVWSLLHQASVNNV